MLAAALLFSQREAVSSKQKKSLRRNNIFSQRYNLSSDVGEKFREPIMLSVELVPF